MMYIDTSVLAAYYCPEPLSHTVDRILTSLRRPAISSLVRVELHSALSRKIRERQLSRDNAIAIKSQFGVHIEEGLYRQIVVQDEHFQLAGDWIAQFSTPLRALDALHLALAQSNALTLLTADLKLAQCATHFGIGVQTLTG